jgi:hypothetical protein
MPYASRNLIRHAYDEVITAAARLASFSVCPLLPGMENIEDRQNELAIGDLLTFSLHMRRLIEISEAEVKQSTVEVLEVVENKSEDKSVPVWRVINIIIHHRRIEVMRRESDSIRTPLDTGEAMVAWLEARGRSYQPRVVVKSDKGSAVGFLLTNFINAAHEGVIDPIVEYCSERELDLEEFDSD